MKLDEASLRGQAEVWKYMFSFADSMAVKCAVELRIPDIIKSNGGPMSLAEIVAAFPRASSPDISCLSRIMRLLVRLKIFTARQSSDGSGDSATLYGLTQSSRWLLRDTSDDQLTLAPMLLLENHPLLMAPWHCFSQCVKDGGLPLEKAHGPEIWDFVTGNGEFNKMFNRGMECASRIVMRAVLSEYYKDGFGCLGSLLDVGGGTGGDVAQIVKSCPHIIKSINFDLPDVVAKAPEHPGVSHVGGDMFKSVPNADAIFMKWIMHEWSDEDCVKILKNCRKAIPEKSGKVIIVDIVLEPEGTGVFDETGLVFDLVMVAHTSGGKERTENEWKNILKEGGFPRYKVTKIPALTSIIEAYPQ
ncbi:xanthohumol 4'-O-methyltransferase [Morus notabilis]|uniref:xanthohumol 4'-O-methyltransferase n=1 Tax=Morus notabilis TaxID=981085 RepID=UPI000CED2A8E|nr:xanthohumol 4'-O-methyltransferase [Morus notabilis]